MLIRAATEADVPRVAELTFEAYVGDGLMPADTPYIAELTDAATRLAAGELIVAEIDGVVAGAVTFAAPGTPYAEKAGPGETEIRMLAVAKAYRGRGIGLALVQRCLARTLELGCGAVRLSTQDDMAAAHRLYERLGFVRTPELDWRPVPEVPLLTYVLDLHGHDEGGSELDPPRMCGACGRRMVVQVTPTGWTARCSEHGVRTS